jgi:GcrA cell cycle regulator
VWVTEMRHVSAKPAYVSGMKAHGAAEHGAKPSTWTDARTEHLRTRWTQGASARRISQELGRGISRSAVLGKVHRLGIGDLSPRGGIRIRRLSSEDRSGLGIDHWPRARDLERHRAFLSRITVAEPRPDDPGSDADTPPVQRRTLLELTRATCRWPVGDPCRPAFFFCGAEAAHTGPYCLLHRTRAYRNGRTAVETPAKSHRMI